MTQEWVHSYQAPCGANMADQEPCSENGCSPTVRKAASAPALGPIEKEMLLGWSFVSGVGIPQSRAVGLPASAVIEIYFTKTHLAIPKMAVSGTFHASGLLALLSYVLFYRKPCFCCSRPP